MPSNSFILPVTPPFDFEQCLTFLRRSDDEVMHVTTEDAVWKLFDVQGGLRLGEIERGSNRKNEAIRWHRLPPFDKRSVKHPSNV